jgi:hypothetical protein
MGWIFAKNLTGETENWLGKSELAGTGKESEEVFILNVIWQNASYGLHP